MLTLCEELFLLAIDDEKSRITHSAMEALCYGLAGGILAELALQNRIAISHDWVEVTDPAPTGDRELDDTSAAIAASKKTRKVSHWIDVLSAAGLTEKYAERLAEKGIIHVEEKRYLWVIPYQMYPDQDASAKYWVKTELRAIVLAGDKPEPDRVVLLSLMKACRLLNLVFTKDERKAAEKKIKELVNGEAFGEAVEKTLEDIEMASMVAVMASIGT